MPRVAIVGAGFAGFADLAGLAGLAGALFLACRGHAVSIVERDDPPPNGTPAKTPWLAPSRCAPGPSVARRCWVALEGCCFDEAPDVIEALLARGVHEIPVVGGAVTLPDERTLLSRRLVAEAELRPRDEAP